MKNDPLNRFINLRKSLLEEKAAHLARLVQIDKALGTPTEATEPVKQAPLLLDEPSPVTGKPKRKVSKASRARMAAAQKARWAKSKAPTQPAEPPKKKELTVSAESKATVRKTAQARRAKK